MAVELSSELEFRHQVTTAGEGVCVGGGGGGYMRAPIEVPDGQKTGSGMEGGG